MSRRCYLSGMDWVVTGLSRAMGTACGTGNWSQVVLELDRRPDGAALERAAQEFARGFPVLRGRASRGWQLAPCWTFPAEVSAEGALSPMEAYTIPAEQRLADALAEFVSQPPGEPGRYAGFGLFEKENRVFLSFRFDHRLFDAGGAELFVRGVLRRLNGEGVELPGEEPPFRPAHLRPWAEKFRSGRQVVRRMRGHRDLAPFQVPCLAAQQDGFQSSLVWLGPDETAAVTEQAYATAGYLMLTPYLAACVREGVLEWQQGRGGPWNGTMIPCSVDLRPDRASGLFFNHASFLMLGASARMTRGEAARQFARQMGEQLRDQMPQHFENAWKLARILPERLYGRLLNGPFRAFGGSFGLANVSGALGQMERVGEARILNVFHQPLVPAVPGLGFFFSSWRGRLNLCMTSVCGVMSAEEHRQLARRVAQGVGGQVEESDGKEPHG